MLMFANSAGLDILETTLINTQDMLLETVLGDEGQKALFLELPKIMNQVIITIGMFYPTMTGAMIKSFKTLDTETCLPLPLLLAGFRAPPCRGVQVEHGAAGGVRAGGGVEGDVRRWGATLPRPHAGQLDLRLKTDHCPSGWLLCSCQDLTVFCQMVLILVPCGLLCTCVLL
jgi:hypothetical protein